MQIWNSSGVAQSYPQTSYGLYIGGKLIRGTDMLMLWEGYSSCAYFGDEETDRILATLLQQLEYAKNIVPPPSGDVPVIFSPRGVAATLLGPLTEGFDGKNIATGASPLIGKEGQRMLDPRVSIYDDPTLPLASGSRPCDDEGVPSRRVTFVEKGVIGEAYFDLQSAGKAGKKSTGSAHRALTSPPMPGTSVIDIAPGDTPEKDLFAGIKEGLVVEELLGAGQGNELGGDFRANVSLGYKIENGEITGRVKDTMIAGNVYKVLSQVEAVSDRAEWVFGSVRTPAIRCMGVQVAAKGG
jgi:PmbA protein